VKGPLWIGIRLRPAGGDRDALSAYLEGFGPGESARSVRVPACRDGCWLEGLTFAGPAGLPAVMHGTFTLSDLTVDGETVPGALADAGWVTAPDVTGDARFGEVSVDDDRLDVMIDTFESPGQVRLVTAAVPHSRPVILGEQAHDNLVAGADGPAISLTGEEFPVDPVRTSRSIPILGPEGVLVDYTMLTTDRLVYDQMFHSSVLARADTPPQIRQSLAGRGFAVTTTRVAEQRTLDRGAYALALRLYLVVAGLVLAMAVAGLVVSSAVQLMAEATAGEVPADDESK
jgi:hypothetical protein